MPRTVSLLLLQHLPSVLPGRPEHVRTPGDILPVVVVRQKTDAAVAQAEVVKRYSAGIPVVKLALRAVQV